MTNDRLPLPPLPLLDGTTLQVSDSTLAKMQACATMAGFKLLWKRERSGGTMSLDAGKAFHSALQARSTSREATFTQSLFFDASKAISDAYTGIDVGDDYRTESRMIDVLGHYRSQWPVDPWDVLATELPFAVPLGSVDVIGPKTLSVIDIVYRGLIDLLVRWDDQIFIVDRKTSADWSEMTMNRYRMSSQFRSYAWVVQELHRTGLVPELPPVVHGAAVDAIVIRKPSTSTRATKPREEFHRRQFFYSQETISEWRSNALSVCKDWLQQYADGRLTMNTGTCANYYGRTCPYLEVCELPVGQRPTMLAPDVYQDIRPGPLDQPTEETAP